MSKKMLGNYQIMIASKYFESIDDFINLEMASKRFNGNMERFHFNPISLNKRIRKFFVNLETLHLFSEKDQVFKDGRIFKKCIWYRVDYSRYLEEKEKGNECKSICYSKKDREKYGENIPNKINILGENCFGFCTLMSTITIPTSVSEFEESAFYNCMSLQSISIPSSVKKLGESCFYFCESLTQIEIPESLNTFNFLCFSDCSSLRTITIPTSITSINYSCFHNCNSLVAITLPSSVQYLDCYSFYGCESLEFVELSDSITRLGDGCFSYCQLLETIELPTALEYIGRECFSECRIYSIDIPKSVTFIGVNCFEGCPESILSCVPQLSTITFKLEYKTVFGEEIALIANNQEVAMKWSNNNVWVGKRNINGTTELEWHYVVKQNKEIKRKEELKRIRKHGFKGTNAVVTDCWGMVSTTKIEEEGK